MPNQIIPSSEIIEELDAQLLAGGFDPETDPIVEALVDPIKTAISTLSDEIINNRDRNILDFATASDLDDKAAEFGINRGELGIPVDSTYENFYIGIKSGKAKEYTIDINEPLTIPVDAISVTDSDNNSYNIPNDIIIFPDSFSAFSPIAAANAIVGGIPGGTIINVQIDINRVQNLDPAKAEDIEFICNNNKEIVSPSSFNTDEEVRDAIILRINSMNNTNRDAIRLVLQGYGISDITFRQDLFGYGTLGVIVKIGGSPVVDSTTINTLNNILTSISGGTRVIEPELLTVKFSARVTYTDNTQIETAKEQILENLRNYFGNMDLGSSLDPDAIKELMSNIELVDTYDTICMFIDDRPCMRTTQTALSDQIFVLNTETPITYVA